MLSFSDDSANATIRIPSSIYTYPLSGPRAEINFNSFICQLACLIAETLSMKSSTSGAAANNYTYILSGIRAHCNCPRLILTMAASAAGRTRGFAVLL